MKALLEECVAVLGAEIDRFPWTERAAYADWLAQTYYYVSHSTRLLATAAGRFALDPPGNALHHRFAVHMKEEKKHELLALHDLRHLGESIERLTERSSTRMFYESQYYKIEREAPIALFGYILPLEAAGPMRCRGVVETLMRTFGANAVSFLKLHVADDVEHLDKAFEMLATVSDAHRTLIEQNMRQTTFAYCTMLSEIQRDLGVGRERAGRSAAAQ